MITGVLVLKLSQSTQIRPSVDVERRAGSPCHHLVNSDGQIPFLPFSTPTLRACPPAHWPHAAAADASCLRRAALPCCAAPCMRSYRGCRRLLCFGSPTRHRRGGAVLWTCPAQLRLRPCLFFFFFTMCTLHRKQTPCLFSTMCTGSKLQSSRSATPSRHGGAARRRVRCSQRRRRAWPGSETEREAVVEESLMELRKKRTTSCTMSQHISPRPARRQRSWIDTTRLCAPPRREASATHSWCAP